LDSGGSEGGGSPDSGQETNYANAAALVVFDLDHAQPDDSVQ
jgi:hypothetical protein